MSLSSSDFPMVPLDWKDWHKVILPNGNVMDKHGVLISAECLAWCRAVFGPDNYLYATHSPERHQCTFWVKEDARLVEFKLRWG